MEEAEQRLDDDQDGGWVNVLLVRAHLGGPGQSVVKRIVVL